MLIIKSAADLHALFPERQKQLAFIPTMGALHAGHISLIRKAREDGFQTLCSIFVNPTQFNERDDYEKYPRSTEADMALLLEAHCDFLFLPSEKEVYPNGTESALSYEFGRLETLLEGAQRPGHFRGVGQVVARLLELVQPQCVYLGQKDFQQCLIIRKLLALMGKSNSIELKIGKTVREPDGLAMSSRNRRLSEPQRALAAVIYQCLISIQTKNSTGNWPVIQKECTELLHYKGFEPEYVALARAADLEPLDAFSKEMPMVALIAARIGEVRLIDNMLLS
ncbi:MAG: pantoate--beta-alanine ligase [Bacteroidetes bacterium]|nr:pantoate--beta-alanine ligase [Bacteroidota bacterium]